MISGTNTGQNIGQPIIDLSGTVGAARAATLRGIPSLAVSTGFLKPPAALAYGTSAQQAVKWLTKNRATLKTAKPTVTNLNVPTCPTGTAEGEVVVKWPQDRERGRHPRLRHAPSPKPTTDVSGFVHGYIVQTNNLSLKPPAK